MQIVPELTVADNFMLVRPPKGPGLRRRSDAEPNVLTTDADGEQIRAEQKALAPEAATEFKLAA
jgi:hypothetical protein